MNRFSKNVKIGLWISLLVIVGCGNDKDLIPDLHGNMMGAVITFDEFGQNFENHTGVTVTAYGYDKDYVIHTNSSGRFEFISLPNGTYQLYFEKIGFGTLIQYGVQHLGGTPTIIPNDGNCYYLYKIAETFLENIEFKNDSMYVSFDSKNDISEKIVTVKLCMSIKDNFSKIETDYTRDLFFKTISNKGVLPMDQLNLGRSPFQPGQTVFVRGNVFTIGCSNSCTLQVSELGGVDTFREPYLDITIYPNMGSISEQYSFNYNE